MKGKHAQKNFGLAPSAITPTPLSLKTPGGGPHTRTGPGRPPPPWLGQGLGVTQQCTNDNTSSSQQTHRRNSISDLLTKFAKWKMTGETPPPLTMQGRGLCKGGGTPNGETQKFKAPSLEGRRLQEGTCAGVSIGHDENHGEPECK